VAGFQPGQGVQQGWVLAGFLLVAGQVGQLLGDLVAFLF
jgi:hypothetical protein